MIPRTPIGWTVVILSILLVATNAWWIRWALQDFDEAITYSYQRDELAWNMKALDNVLTIIPKLGSTAKKAELVSEAEALFEDESFEKDGCVWVGSIGLKFDKQDNLIHISRQWSFGEEDPCFP